jgi:hypothetical protein
MIKGGGALKTLARLGVAGHRKIYLAETLSLGEHGAAGKGKNCEGKSITSNRFHGISFSVFWH